MRTLLQIFRFNIFQNSLNLCEMSRIRSRTLFIFLLLLFPFLAYSKPNVNVCELGAVRVETSDSSHLQVCIKDANNKLVWAFICGDTYENPWTYDNAYVWCRSRHAMLASESTLGSLSPLKQTPELKLKDVHCNRTQDAIITDCDFTRTTEACQYIHGVTCQFCTENSGCNSPGVCNVETSHCLCNVPCHNGGFCDLGRCQCMHPYYGESCQNKHCSSQCLDAGECALNGTCQCQGDNYGDSCQFKNCNPECQNGGVCSSTGECECPEPFHGNHCQHVQCTSSCQNGGECLSNGTCHCLPSFYGSFCELKTCPNSCGNDGLCLANGTCQCHTSFYGEACQFKLCTDSCNNNGTCLSNGTCLCSSSFYGNACQLKYCVDTCNDGTCLSNGTCLCSSSFYGNACQLKYCVDTCNDGICLSNGTCQCKLSFYGDACEFKSCTTLCLNGGECNASTGVCDCTSPYGGPTCKDITSCVYDCEFLVISPGNMLILIIVGSSVGITIFLIIIFTASLCLIKTAKKSRSKPRPTELSMRELPKPPEEPLYEYLDGDLCAHAGNAAATGNQFGDSYLSNEYHYVHFPVGIQGYNHSERQDSLDLTYASVDANGYEVPLPISKINHSHLWKLTPGKDQLSESYVKMYPASSCPSLL